MLKCLCSVRMDRLGNFFLHRDIVIKIISLLLRAAAPKDREHPKWGDRIRICIVLVML